MNPLTIVLSSLVLLIPVVMGRSTNNVRRRDPSQLPKATDSSEEFDQYLADPGQSSGYVSIPPSFDARIQWVQCPSIAKVPSQGLCDRSYALIPTAVMTDRTCIVRNRTDVVYSVYDVMACCDSCATNSSDKCEGGKAEEVWKYWANTGIASEGCLTRKFEPDCTTQSCSRECTGMCTGMSSKSVPSDRRRGEMYYKVNPTVRDIQQEIMKNGPVEASIPLYLDLVVFRGKGVYEHKSGPFVSQHSVKIVGWGTQLGTDYWIIMNTFSAMWGDHGLAKFLRGKDHLGIESNVHAAMPLQ